MSLGRFLAALRHRMWRRDADAPAVPVQPPRRARPHAVERDDELEQLEAEARYHHDRADLYRARVISGSSAATSAVRLRELERTAAAAADRLAHVKRARASKE